MSWNGFTSEWLRERENRPVTGAPRRATNGKSRRSIATQAQSNAAKRHKYGAVATERDGIRFDSRLEADRYRELTLLRASGEVSHFLRQTPIHLPSGTKLVIDFLVFWSDGSVTYEDTKGRQTPVFRVKRREVEYLYPFKITILTRADVSRFDF